jgi:hypothetical protein
MLAAIFASGCVLDSNSTNAPSAGSGKIFSMGSKYDNNGGIGALDRISDSVAANIKTWPTSDIVLGADAGVLYVIQRINGVVTGFQGGDVTKPTLDINVGGGANPYAVSSLSGKLWVACYGSRYLKAVGLSSKTLVDSIDLSAYSDVGDSQVVPDMIDVKVWNGKLAVVLGRLNGWKPGDATLVLVIDPTTKHVDKRIALPWKNAYGAAWSGNQVLVACVGSWNDLTDGGLALVDLNAGTAKALLSEKTAGGNISMAAFGPSGKAFVGVTDANYNASALVVDLATGALGAKVSGTANVGALAWDGTQLWVGDHNDAAPMLLRVDAAGNVLGKVPTTLAPGSMAILQ